MSKAILPIDVKRIKSHQPCESCGVKMVRYKATFQPPGTKGVTHRLCKTCMNGLKNG